MKTPVAFLIFNRPDTTELVFEAIRQARPPKLLVVADAPRHDRPGEAEKCEAARAVISQVDWDCEVLTNYSDINLGCRKRISSGLDWVFEMVEEAIILEDDCLPHPSFFRFCEELLDYYRQDSRVMHIAGSNFELCSQRPQESYFFSRLTPIWGWATWRRAWRYFDVDISLWPELKVYQGFRDLWGSQQEQETRYKNWDAIYAHQIDAWSFQWHIACLSQGNYSVVPSKNLISNLGFRQDALHTTDPNNPLANIKTDKVEFPLVHPQFFIRDSYADNQFYKKMYASGLANRVGRKLKRLSRTLLSH